MSISSAVAAIADDFKLGSYRDFRLVASGTTACIKFSKLKGTLSGLIMTARKRDASAKYTANVSPPSSSRAAPLMSRLFNKLKRFTGYASSVHMLDMARANAWPHLSARASKEVLGSVPPSAPCLFCDKNAHQTTAHCLPSGACSEFQKLKVDRHETIVEKFVSFLRTRTVFHHIASVGSVLTPVMFQSGKHFDHSKPDVFAQDPESGATRMFDITVVMPERMAHAYSDKMSRYKLLSEEVDGQAAVMVPSAANLVTRPEGCQVFPVVFSVFGDMYDESYSDIKDLVSCGAESGVAPFLMASCKAIALCASAVAVATSKKYAGSRHRL